VNIPGLEKKFWFCEKICERLPAVLAAVVVSAKGWEVVPLKRAADEFPKPRRFNEPVTTSVSLAGTRLVDA
jgi:hypothetical protein